MSRVPKVPPVLLIAFNRTNTLEEVIRALAPVAPPRMYVAADGPRAHVAADQARCTAVRALLTNLPWKCEIATRFPNSNAGCARGVSGAISWFFEHEEEGVILEDDCVPDASFLGFAAELLDRHRNDTQVMSISGTRMARSRPEQQESYRFSRYFSAWGWASWRRAWQRFELDLGDWRSKCVSYGVPSDHMSRAARRGWSRRFDEVVPSSRHTHVHTAPHTWDFQWTFAHFRYRGLSALPKVNLVTNIGAGADATHTSRAGLWFDIPRQSMELPTIPPRGFLIDEEADVHHELWAKNHRPWLMRKWWQFRNRHSIGSLETRRGWLGS
jgi:hypothetical protein